MWPAQEEIDSVKNDAEVKNAHAQMHSKESLHYLAKTYLDKDEVKRGFAILMSEI